MTTPTQAARAEEVRAAALGRAPRDVESLAAWVPPSPVGAFFHACDLCRRSGNYLLGADETQARTFLLFVACALEG